MLNTNDCYSSPTICSHVYWQADPTMYPKAQASGIAYAAFAGVGTAILIHSIYPSNP
jgi:hypothetical protein